MSKVTVTGPDVGWTGLVGEGPAPHEVGEDDVARFHESEGLKDDLAEEPTGWAGENFSVGVFVPSGLVTHHNEDRLGGIDGAEGQGGKADGFAARSR